MSELLVPKVAVREEIRPRVPLAVVQGPRLLWPSIEYGDQVRANDMDRFPETYKVRERHRAISQGQILGLVAFEEAVLSAEDRVLVLDRHFDETGARALEDALSLSHVWDVRLLTGRVVDEKREELRRVLTDRCNSDRADGRTVDVQWRTSLGRDRFPFLHDRFAIVDGTLWHFGSTVGGSHSGLNAVSGPWSAEATHAVTFFNECWVSHDA